MKKPCPKQGTKEHRPSMLPCDSPERFVDAKIVIYLRNAVLPFCWRRQNGGHHFIDINKKAGLPSPANLLNVYTEKLRKAILPYPLNVFFGEPHLGFSVSAEMHTTRLCISLKLPDANPQLSRSTLTTVCLWHLGTEHCAQCSCQRVQSVIAHAANILIRSCRNLGKHCI